MGTAARERTRIATAAATVAVAIYAQSLTAQFANPSQNHVTIPFLASVTQPTDLQFEGAECDLATNGRVMTCAFQQLFLTTSSIAPDTCLVTTNRYDRVFRRDSPNRWTSSEGPDGPCGLLDVATLTNEGDIKWTMELKKDVTRKEGSAACLTLKSETEVFSWRNIRRSLPCRNIQPGALNP